MADTSSNQPPPSHASKAQHAKLPRLPKNASIHKRPLLHAPLASPYSNSQQQKIVYVSTKTPFLSAVKRVEKLLHLSEKRFVQSATTAAKHDRGKRKRGNGGEDEILEIAETLEARKKRRRVEGSEVGEEVILKGTGKAVQKVLQLGLWFQQREEYRVILRTGSVGAVDDVIVGEGETEGMSENEVEEDANEEDGGVLISGDVVAGADLGAVEVMDTDIGRHSSGEKAPLGRVREREKNERYKMTKDINETRIRYTSVLEVAVSLQ